MTNLFKNTTSVNFQIEYPENSLVTKINPLNTTFFLLTLIGMLPKLFISSYDQV